MPVGLGRLIDLSPGDLHSRVHARINAQRRTDRRTEKTGFLARPPQQMSENLRNSRAVSRSSGRKKTTRSTWPSVEIVCGNDVRPFCRIPLVRDTRLRICRLGWFTRRTRFFSSYYSFRTRPQSFNPEITFFFSCITVKEYMHTLIIVYNLLP